MDEKRILEQCISGYHEYELTDPCSLSYASRSLSELLMYAPEELVTAGADLYMPLVHPADIGRYRRFLSALQKNEETRSVQYRLVKRNGEIIYVVDTMTSRRRPDGGMTGYSVLTDITMLKKEEEENVRLISETVPCGLLRYTCEKTPRITYVNEQMLQMMRIPEQSSDVLDPAELYQSNIYLMIAPDSRERFARVLREVFLKGVPCSGEMNVIRGDGSGGRLFGWVAKYRTSEGKEEFQSVCMDVTERYMRKQNEQENRYLNVLKGVFDLIFEFDRERRTVRYLHGNLSYLGEYLEGIPMQLEQATEKWLNRAVAEQDRPVLRSFFSDHVLKGVPLQELSSKIPFRFLREDGTEGVFEAVLLETGTAGCYFCCKERQEDAKKSVQIRTFGYFDVFVDGKAVMFKTEKAKELLAVLVDRRGGYVSPEEAISLLWEDEPVSPLILARYRKVALRLKNHLEEHGITGIVESINGKRRLVTEAVDCDLYRYLEDPAGHMHEYRGSYLTNYSWGEVTLGELENLSWEIQKNSDKKY